MHNTQRRTFIGGSLAALMASPKLASANDDKNESPNDPFIVLLQGIYQSVPAGSGPSGNLGLTTVNLNDGSFIKTRFILCLGLVGTTARTTYPINQSVRSTFSLGTGNKCAYDLPGGSIAMQFTGAPKISAIGFNTFVPVSDRQNGLFLEGTFELVILEATGVYSNFTSGHNHMVDKLHKLASGQFDEFCFCNITSYPFP